VLVADGTGSRGPDPDQPGAEQKTGDGPRNAPRQGKGDASGKEVRGEKREESIENRYFANPAQQRLHVHLCQGLQAEQPR